MSAYPNPPISWTTGDERADMIRRALYFRARARFLEARGHDASVDRETVTDCRILARLLKVAR